MRCGGPSLLWLGAVCAMLAPALGRYFTEQWAMLSGRGADRPRCTPIPRNLTLCYGMEYTQMRLPNLVEHETLDEVIQQAASWVPLVRLNCHPDAQLFLCGVFAPVCLNVDRAIPPCRSLCQQVRHACGRRMLAYGFPWPDMLACDRYPVTNDMCIQPRGDTQNNSTCEFCNQVSTYENILDHFCRSDYVVKAKLADIKSSSVTIRRGRSLKLPRNEAVWRLTSGGRRRRHVVRQQTVRFAEDGRPCPCHALHGDKRLAQRGAQRFLVMASRAQGGAYWVANMVLPWHKQKSFKRAVRQFRRIDCGALGRVIRDRARRRMPPGEPAGRYLNAPHADDEPWYRR